ncbi:MAG: SUMF1/EgtB/PvdO family nonheme iron enzyme [Hyphomicrobiaceae bacterium]
MRMARWGALLTVLALLVSALPALAAKRVALVIGIDVYDNLDQRFQLQKAVNDARAMGAALQTLGFEVTISQNAGRIELIETWARFLGSLEPGDTAALFFAGHGVEIGGVNYLVPRDVPKVSSEVVLKAASIRVAELLDGLRDRGPQVSLLILDACRDNPFVDGQGRSMGASRGLARETPARGTFVMFSADAGQKALDRMSNADPDPNSVYTRSLLPLLTTPGLGLREIAVEVRTRVNALARTIGEDQFPAYYDAMQSDLRLAGEKAADESEAASASKVEPKAEPVAPLSEEAKVWPTIEHSTSCGVLESFAKRFPGSIYARLRGGPAEGAAVRRGRGGRCGADAEGHRAVRRLRRVGRGAGQRRRRGQEARRLPEAGRCVPRPRERPRNGGDPGRTVHHGLARGRGGASRKELAEAIGDRAKDLFKDEGPQHEVTIAAPFAVGKFEVTFAEWDACVKAGGCKHKPEDEGWGRGKRPVINVSWHDAKAYVAWLAKETGQPYRLLSEAEWEYAARAGTTTRYHFGDTFDGSKANDGSRTVEVGKYPANAFGLHDMHGNVWEWVEDAWVDNYRGAPTDGTARKGADTSVSRVLRGGSWIFNPQSLRAASRSGGRPDDPLWVWVVGFRLARTLNPTP